MKKTIVCVVLSLLYSAAAQEKAKLVVNAGHSADVQSVVFSADGTRLITADSRRVKLWELDSGREIRTLADDGGTAACISADGKFIASSSADGMIRIRDAETGKELRALKGHSGGLYHLTFSPDGKTLLSCGSDSASRGWDTQTGAELFVLNNTSISRWTFFAGSTAALASGYNVNDIRDIRTAAVVHKLGYYRYPKGYPGYGTFSCDGKTLVYIKDSRIVIMDPQTHEVRFDLLRNSGKIDQAVFSPDGIAAVLADKELFLIAPGKKKSVETLETERHQFSWATFSPDGKLLAAAEEGKPLFDKGEETIIRLWKPSGRKLCTLAGHPTQVLRAFFSPDGKLIATVCKDSSIRVWSTDSGKLISTMKGNCYPVSSLAAAAASNGFASASADGRLMLWNPDGTVRLIASNQRSSSAIALNAAGPRLASALRDFGSALTMWDLSTGKTMPFSKEHNDKWVRSVNFSADGKRLVSTGDDKYINVYDAADGRLVFSRYAASGLSGAALSPDGTQLISSESLLMLTDTRDQKSAKQLGFYPGTKSNIVIPSDGVYSAQGAGSFVTVCPLAGGALRHFKGHTGNVLSIAADREGKRIVSASYDGTARIWDIVSGKQLQTLPHGQSVIAAVFTSDGSRVITSCGDAAMRVWNASSGALVATIYSPSGTDYTIVAPDGRFDGTETGLGLIHWVAGSEVIPLSDFGDAFRERGLLASALAGALPASEPKAAAEELNREKARPDIAKRLAGKIHSISGNEIVVAYSGSGYMPKAGEKLFVIAGSGEKVMLECVFPMISLAKCRSAGKSAEVKKGMPVFR